FIKLFYLIPFARLLGFLQSRTHTIKARYILLQLTPRSHKANSPQVFQSQFFVEVTFNWPTTDVDLRQKFEGTQPFEVLKEQRIMAQRKELVVAHLGHVFNQLLFLFRKGIATPLF